MPKKLVSIRKDNYKKLERLSEDWGMTTNQTLSYITNSYLEERPVEKDMRMWSHKVAINARKWY